MDNNSTKDCLIVGEGVSISGVIQLAGTIRVDGSVEGTIDAAEVLVGVTGKITGKVTTRVAEIHGQVKEGLFARERVTVRATGRVEGALTYKSIAVEHGGIVEGKINFLDETAVSEPKVEVAPAGKAK